MDTNFGVKANAEMVRSIAVTVLDIRCDQSEAAKLPTLSDFGRCRMMGARFRTLQELLQGPRPRTPEKGGMCLKPPSDAIT